MIDIKKDIVKNLKAGMLVTNIYFEKVLVIEVDDELYLTYHGYHRKILLEHGTTSNKILKVESGDINKIIKGDYSNLELIYKYTQSKDELYNLLDFMRKEGYKYVNVELARIYFYTKKPFISNDKCYRCDGYCLSVKGEEVDGYDFIKQCKEPVKISTILSYYE